MKNLGEGKFFGSVTVGERGQVVIPADVRKSFKIKSGDKLVVLGKPGMEMFSFIPAENFNQFLGEAAKLFSKLKGKTSQRA